MALVLQFICCIGVSFLVWFIFGMILLSPQFGIIGTDLFGPANIPFSKIIAGATIIGIVQGSLMAVLIFWAKPNLIAGYCISGFLTTEILLFAAMLMHIFFFTKNNQIILNTSNLFQGMIFFIFWYLVLSLIFLIPSVIIGIITRKVLATAESIMFL